MSKKSIIQPTLHRKNAPPPPTKAELENAGKDAAVLISQSPVLQACLLAMTTIRRLYILYREQLDYEIQHGWETDNPHLIIRTIEQSAEHQAVAEPATLAQLRQDTQELLLNYMDLLIQQQNDLETSPVPEKPNADATATTLPRTPHGSPAERPAVPDGTGGHPVDEAGIPGGGDRPEEGQAG